MGDIKWKFCKTGRPGKNYFKELKITPIRSRICYLGVAWKEQPTFIRLAATVHLAYSCPVSLTDSEISLRLTLALYAFSDIMALR
jgi:hypothetical protein